MDSIKEIQEAIDAIELPIEIPSEAFALIPKDKAPDVLLIVAELPQELREMIDLDFTAVSKQRGGKFIYWLPLLISSTLKITLEHHSITELELEP
jgi:hypothetical protein